MSKPDLAAWRKVLPYDPLDALLESGDEALVYFVKRDLLGEGVAPIQALWDQPEVRRILKKQGRDGAWLRPGKQPHPVTNHSLIETWKQFRVLVDQYELTREHPQVENAAEFVFSCQAEGGDIRGMIGNQYATYYSGAWMALLIKAGYGEDPRIESGFQWLLGMRQSDGGWSIPMITHKFDRETQYRLVTEEVDPVEPDRSKPFSHNWTGMVLRAFAAHPSYRHSPAAKKAAGLLKSRFFVRDAYSSYQAASYWVRFDYPFWWNNLVAALDTLSWLGFTREDEDVCRGLDWLIEHQGAGGLWQVTYAKPGRESKQNRQKQLWVTLAICRIFQRFFKE